ncbi:MAG: twin-arginine translocase subunit TatC [Bdellovibrionota bacterium]
MTTKHSTEKPSSETEGFISHLEELRKRVLYSMIFISIAFCFCWNYSTEIFNVIRKPIAPYLETAGGGLVFTGVMDKFMAHLKVSFLAAIIISCPFWIYQAWQFVAPGLYTKEKKYGASFIIAGSVLFLGGIFFVYYFVYPTTFEFLMNFGGDTDKPLITISDYISFFILTTLMFGLVFELPLVIVLLGVLGIVDAKFLRAKRRYAMVILAIIAAIATPTPDALSMAIMFGPLVALYEVSIFFVAWFGKKRVDVEDAI